MGVLQWANQIFGNFKVICWKILNLPTSPNSPPSHSFPFLHLAPEVRLLSYRHMLSRDRPIPIRQAMPQEFRAILETSRVVRNEAVQSYYRYNTFQVGNLKDMLPIYMALRRPGIHPNTSYIHASRWKVDICATEGCFPDTLVGCSVLKQFFYNQSVVPIHMDLHLHFRAKPTDSAPRLWMLEIS